MGVSSLRQACHYSMYPGYGLMVHTLNFNYNYKSVPLLDSHYSKVIKSCLCHL